MLFGGSWYCMALSRPLTFVMPFTGCWYGCTLGMSGWPAVKYGLFHVL